MSGERTPAETRDESTWRGFEVGPTFSLPVAAASASREELGLDAGLSYTQKRGQSFGVGVDVAYHYWPVSSAFKESFNELLRDRTLNILKLGGTTWRLSTLEFSAHLRFAAPTSRVLRPWLQVGAGLYYTNPNTAGYSGDAGFFTVSAGPLKTTDHFGWHCTTGVDLFGAPHSRGGLDASYHRVNCRDDYGTDLEVFSVGVHALFGH